MSRALAIMAKRPAPGRTKTRLVPHFSPADAAAFYEQMLRDTIDQVSGRTDCHGFVATDSPDSDDYFADIAPALTRVAQGPGALGDRLNTVLGSCLELGHDHAFAIGSDSPDLPSTHIDAAFDLLEDDEVDVVLGPSDDGGYWLIGWKQSWPRLVCDVVMSTPSVLTDTIAIAAELGARVGLAPRWSDVDAPPDIERLVATIDPVLAPRTAAFLTRRSSA